MLAVINKLLHPIRDKIISMIAKALITNVDDSQKIQLVQIDLGNDEKIDTVERVQNFGLTSFPVSGSQAVVLFLAGEREHPIVIVTDDGDNRPTLVAGEAAVYNAYSDIVKLENGTIKIGRTTFKKLIKEEFQAMFNSHVHNISVAGTPAAQLGTSSSPTKLAVGGAIAVAPIAGPLVNLFGDAISNNEMTSITKAE